MRFIPLAFACAVFTVTSMGAVSITSSEANAQATCRSKCNAKEQACLKRTNNKGQCGRKAKTCASKCK